MVNKDNLMPVKNDIPVSG